MKNYVINELTLIGRDMNTLIQLNNQRLNIAKYCMSNIKTRLDRIVRIIEDVIDDEITAYPEYTGTAEYLIDDIKNSLTISSNDEPYYNHVNRNKNAMRMLGNMINIIEVKWASEQFNDIRKSDNVNKYILEECELLTNDIMILANDYHKTISHEIDVYSFTLTLKQTLDRRLKNIKCYLTDEDDVKIINRIVLDIITLATRPKEVDSKTDESIKQCRNSISMSVDILRKKYNTKK